MPSQGLPSPGCGHSLLDWGMAYRNTRVAICQADHSTLLNVTTSGLHFILLLVLCPLDPAEEDLDYSATAQRAASLYWLLQFNTNLMLFQPIACCSFLSSCAREGTKRKGSAQEAHHAK